MVFILKSRPKKMGNSMESTISSIMVIFMGANVIAKLAYLSHVGIVKELN